MSERICLAAFSKAGVATAQRIRAVTGGDIWAPPQHGGQYVHDINGSVTDWAGKVFSQYDAIIFVSACGIAVRAIAPHLKGKDTDPATVVLDERGRRVISLLSGHLGGANALARQVASITGGEAVITTASDVSGVPAIDEWSKERGYVIENLGAAKKITAAALEGEKIGVAITEELLDAPWPVTLWLRPRNLVLGAGCRKGVSFERLKDACEHFLSDSGVSALSIMAVASIDIKKEEGGLIELAHYLDVPFNTFSARELNGVPGSFTSSKRVQAATGTDNVCERAAVLLSRGFLLRSKTKYDGVTFALAKTRRRP